MLIYNGVLLFSFRHSEHKRLIEILFNRYQFLLSTHFRMSLKLKRSLCCAVLCCIALCIDMSESVTISTDFMVIIRLFYRFTIVIYILLAGAY